MRELKIVAVVRGKQKWGSWILHGYAFYYEHILGVDLARTLHLESHQTITSSVTCDWESVVVWLATYATQHYCKEFLTSTTGWLLAGSEHLFRALRPVWYRNTRGAALTLSFASIYRQHLIIATYGYQLPTHHPHGYRELISSSGTCLRSLIRRSWSSGLFRT